MKALKTLRSLACAGLGAALAASVTAAAFAQAPCGTCDREIVTNGELADCFLEQYQTYAANSDGVVFVDLSGCPASRGVVKALSDPVASDPQAAEPTLQFYVPKQQLDCLAAKLKDPQMPLDPSAKIELDGCP